MNLLIINKVLIDENSKIDKINKKKDFFNKKNFEQSQIN